MWQKPPAKNQLWTYFNFRSPKTLSEEPFSSLISLGAFPPHILPIPKPCPLLHTSPFQTPQDPSVKHTTPLKNTLRMLVTDFSHTKPCISKAPLAAEFIQPPKEFCGGTSTPLVPAPRCWIGLRADVPRERGSTKPGL